MGRFVTFLILSKISFFCRYNINIDIYLSGISTKHIFLVLKTLKVMFLLV